VGTDVAIPQRLVRIRVQNAPAQNETALEPNRGGLAFGLDGNQIGGAVVPARGQLDRVLDPRVGVDVLEPHAALFIGQRIGVIATCSGDRRVVCE